MVRRYRLGGLLFRALSPGPTRRSDAGCSVLNSRHVAVGSRDSSWRIVAGTFIRADGFGSKNDRVTAGSLVVILGRADRRTRWGTR